jgi:hypothetical protein
VGGVPGAFAGPAVADLLNKASTKFANQAIGHVALGVRPLVDKLMPGAEKLAASKIPELLNRGAPLASRLASAGGTIAQRADAQPFEDQPARTPGTPGTNGQLGAQLGAAPGIVESDPVNMQRLDSGIARGWFGLTNGYYGDASEDNPNFVDYKTGVMNAIKDNGQSPTINPKLAANVMFANPDQREAFINAITAKRQLGASMPLTRGPTDVIGNIFHPEAQAAKGQIVETLSKAIGGGEEGKKAIQRILNGLDSKKSKFEKLTKLLQSNPSINKAMTLGGGNGV